MRRRNQNEQRRNPSVDSNARDRKPGVMFPTTPENQGVPIEDVRSSYSRLTSTSSQRTAQRHVSMLEASRHRLSIRKIAAFPMQQTAPKPFLASCADITRYARNWNAEFQFAWEAEDNTISQAVSRMEALRRIEKEFVEEATRKAKQIVTLDDNGPRELPKFLQCYRVDNIFFRVLPDSRSGRNYVASLRGVLQSRSRLLTVPLSCMIFYRGMPVLAQALVPMSANPTRLYGAESTDDSEVEAEILHMADALNIPFPDGTLEVYEGLDGRLYLTNSNSTLTPLFVDDTIMKRQEMLRLCGNVTDGHMDTVSLLDNTEVLDRIVHACVDSESRSNGERLRKLCDVLHSIGINMCLLKQVVCKTEGVGRYSPDVTQRVRELISIEMIARSVKQEFYLEVQGKRVAYDDDILAGTVSKHIGAAFTNLDNFRSIFLEVVAKKYGIIDSDEDLIKSLTDIRMGRKADIVARICALIGVSIEKTSKNHTVMRWHAHVNASVLPKLIDPQYVRALSEKYRTIVTQDGYRYAFCLPVRWKVACWDGHYDEALALVRETAKAHMELCAPVSLSPLYSRRSVCEVCFATMEKDYIAEGRGLFPDTMRGFEELTGPVTQGRLHIEYGFWLLRVATLYQSDELATYRSCVEEAAKHFYSAIEKLPGYLKSEHGAWLHLQPYKGLLQCKQLLPSCSVNTKELVSHSVELSTIGWASDYFMYYLWDLSLQLESEGWYEDAIRVLLTAITISKKKPTESRDLPSLLTDGAHIYRSWDREKYVEHCMTLLREAGDKAADLFGVQSREYAVVQNNKGAIEIDLNRLSDAGESLKRAGLAFDKAGVPKDDPDFLAYLENLRYLEQHLSSRPVVYRGILQRYPFLATRVDSFPFVDVRLLEDEVFVELAHQRARASKDTTESRQLEQAMKERMWELHRSIQEGDILKRYPFLRAEVHGVRTASLRLEDDGFFMDLVHKLRSSDDSKQTNALEYAICEYVAKKAKDTALERAFVDRQEQEFSDTHGGYVNLMLPIPWIYVLEDEQVRTLIDQIRKCTMSQSLGPGLVQIQGQLASRVDEIELDAFRWRKELSPWLSSSKRYSVSATDLAGDTHLHDLLRVHRLCVSRGDAEAEWIHALISAKLEAMWERASIVRTCLAVDDEELHQQFPFLEERPYHQRLSMLRLHEDSAAATLMDQLAKKNTDSKLQSELAVAVHHLAARRHDDNELQRLNYDVESFTTENFVVETVPNMRDDYYVVLSQRRNAEFKNNADDSPTALGLTHQMEERVLQMNVWVRKVNANRFRRRQRSEAKYPFVSRRHLGFTLDALDVEGDNEFMALVIAREKLTTMKPVVVAEVDKLNARANDRVAWLAVRRTTQIKEHNQKYPFIPSRMEGIDTSTMHLEENQKFAQKAEQYSKLPNSLGTSNDLRRKRLVREMLNHALAIARESNVRQWREAIESEDLRERYPFLPEEPVRGVCLADVRPAQQQEFRDLSNELDELRRDPAGNSETIAAMEEKMKALVTQLAEENATKTDAVHKQYPFLPKRVMGIPLGELPIKDDEVFAASEKETTTKKETVLQSRVVQLASGAHLSEVLLADADDAVLSGNPFLIYTTRKCFPLRHIRLSEDNLFNQLLAEYKSLLQRFKLDEDSVASVRFRLACRADEIALEEIKKIEKIMEMFHELKPLSLEDIRLLESQGVLAMTGDGSLDAVHPDLLNSVRDILENERKGRAAKVREVDELRKTYPMLGRNIDPNMLHNPLVAKLVGDHDELMDDIDKNAEKLQRLEAELARTTQEIMTSTPSDVSDDEIKDTHDTGLSQDEINTYIEEEIMNDKYYQELHREYQRIKEEGTPAGIKLQRILQTRMAMRKSQLHKAFRSEIEAEERKVGRLMKIFQNIQKTVKGIKIASLNIYEDNEIQQLLKEEQRTVRDNEKKQQIEVNKTKRVRAIVEERKAEEESLAAAYPFLGRTLKGIPLGELHLMSDPTFAELASHYTQDASNMDPTARAQQEKLLRDAADKIVSDLRSSRLRAAVRAEGLRERYPFLPEEPVRGVCLADVRPAQQQEFRDLSNELDELRRDPAGDAEAIAAMEEKMKALVTQLAEENATKTDAVHKQYPFLPKRVMGIPLGELPINDDAMFSQLGQRWLQQKSSSDGGKDAVATEEEMLQRVKDLARLARLAEKESEDANEYVRACNPFLLYEDRKCVLLSDIPLSKDDGYQKLFNEHLSALEDAEANAERLTELEEALRARADELALNESVRRALLNKCPFLASQDGLELSEKLLHDPVFQQQCARYDELMRDPVKNADALRQLEREMSLSMKSAAGGDPTASGSVGGAGALDGTSAAKGARTSSDGESFAGGLPGARGSVAAVVYPFLPETFLGVSQAELYLEDDPYFQELLARYNELVPDGRKPESPLEKQIYEQLCRRAGQIAGDVLKLQSAEQRAAARDASLYSFVDPSLLAEVPRDLTLEDDDEFCELMKRRDEEKAKGPNEVNAEVIREAEAGLAKRVRAIVEERKAEEESLAAAYPFLGRTLKGIPLGELHLMSDPTFAELASHYTQDASNMDPTARAQQEKLLRDAADKIVSDLRSSRLRAAVRAEGLRERYPFLPEEPVRGVCLADVRPAQQQEFRDLSNELDELRRDPAGNSETIAAMEEKMKALVTQLAEENATKTDAVHKQYPFLPKRVMGIPLGELPINDDAMFSQLGQRWLQQKSSSDGGKDAVATEEEMLQRVKDLARLARLAEKESEDANEYVRACNPFLLYEDRKCVLLSDIPLSKDDGYQKLFNEHLSALEDAEANAERLTELEEALRARADELALNESVRRALLNKCPFLASQDGLELSEKLLHDPVFQQQCARYDELMRDPVKNADALRQLEREMSLSMKSAAGGDPTASGSVGGAGALDGTSAAKGARTSSDGESFAGGLPGARGSVAAVVYPFLPETFLGVSQAELYLEDDPYFQELLARYNELVPDGRKPESPLEKQIYEQLCRRAGQIAGDVLKLQSAEQRAAARDASLYSFVDPSLLAEVPRDLTLEDDDEFCELMKRRDEEKAKGPNEVNAEVIREAEAGLAKRVRAIVEERKAEEESLAAAYPFLGRTLKGIPLGELHLMSDPTFAELASHYTQDASNMDPTARAQQEKLLRDAADKIVSDLRSSRLRAAVRAEGLRERYPFLPEEPVRGVCLADVRPAQQQEFRDLSNELDELRRDPAGDAEAIAAMEEKMKALVTQLAEENATKTDAVHKQYPFLPKRVMGIPLGELPINDGAMFSQLGQRWLQQKSSSDGGKDAVATEEEMLQRVKDLARLARLAEKESEDANEYVRACNPFLLYEDRKCVLLSDIPLSKDDGYQKLFNEHLSALEDAEANAERLTELEEALRARADELALNESVRRALLNKCPFLASQDGLELSEKLLHDPVFQQQCARYDELMRDPVKNADALRQLEREMSLSMKSAAGGDPTASGSVGGAGALDGTSAAKGARTSSDGESFAGGLPGARGSVAAVVYPFLPETFLGVSQAELYLEDDPYFQELLARYNELVPDGRKPESPLEKQIYEQLCRRAGQIAGDVLKLQSAEQRAAARDASLYSFVDPSLLAEVPRDLTLEDDDEFCELMKRRDEEKAKGPNEVNAEVIREAEAGLAKRVRAIVEERKAEEESLAAAYPFLGRTLKGIPLGELHLMSDPTFAELASHYTQDASNMDPTARAQQEKLLRDAADKIVSDLRSSRLRAAVRAEGLRERYPFLPEEPVRGVCLADVRPAQQQEFRDLSNELDELRLDWEGNSETIAAMEEKMKALVTQLAEENATKTDAVHKQYPFLPKRVMGIPLGELPINDDAMFSQLGQRWLQQKSSSDGGKDAVATEEEMLQRVKDLARLARLAEKESEDANEYVRACNPFLLYEDRKCVLLSDIPLSKDDGYQKLFNEHLSALEDAEANAERLTELEEALRARADELALNESVRRALLNKCPFLASQDGLELSEKLLHDPVFQQQCARYDELMRDPVKNADALRQLEREMSLSMKSAAGGDPTASGSVGGAGALDGTSAAKGARTSSDGESFAGGLPGARGSVAAVVYPFLPETFLGVSQAELYLEDDPYFQELLARYNELVPDGRKPESPLEKQIYEQLCRRAGQIAGDVLKLQSAEQRAAARDASLYSFVDPSLLAEVPRDLTLEDDDEFCELMKRRDEEKAKGPNEVNAEVIREAEAGLAKRVRAIVEERKAEEESLAAAYPFLGRTLKGIPLGELHLMSDPTFAELASHYTQDASNMDPTARAQQEKLLRDAADKIVSDLRSSRLRAAVRAEGLRERYPFLPEEPVRGVCLADVRPAQQQEFRDLSNELDELRLDWEGNSETIAAMEEKMKALVTQLAEENATKTDAVHKQYPFLPKRVMGIPLGELPINDDAMFSQLCRRRARQAKLAGGAKGAVAIEKEMLQRVKDLARLARLAEKESEDANEYVRACNPFLLYEDRKCVLLSDIPLSKDDGYQKLFNEHLSALEDAEANAERLTELEEALRARADELALNESIRCALLLKYPFLSSLDGLNDLTVLLRDPAFQQQCARYDELMRDPVKNADALRELEEEMNRRGEYLSCCDARGDGRKRAMSFVILMTPSGGNAAEGASNLVGTGSRKSFNVSPRKSRLSIVDADQNQHLSSLMLMPNESAMECFKETEVVSFDACSRRKLHKMRGQKRRKTHFFSDGGAAVDGEEEALVGDAETVVDDAAVGVKGDHDDAAEGALAPSIDAGVGEESDNLKTAAGAEVVGDETSSAAVAGGVCDDGKSGSICAADAEGAEGDGGVTDVVEGEGAIVNDGSISGLTDHREADALCASERDAEGSAEKGDRPEGDELLALRRRRMEEFDAELEELLVLENRSRSLHEEDERHDRDHIMLTCEDEEKTMENRRRAAEKVKRLVGEEEPGARREVEAGEKEEIEDLRQAQMLSLRLIECVVALSKKETEKRHAIEAEERKSVKAINCVRETSARDALTAQEQREKDEQVAKKEVQKQEATSLIKSVIFAYRARRRLANRFLNRRAHEHKNAMEDIYGVEHNSRLAIVNEEKSDLQGLFELKDFLTQKVQKVSHKVFVELEKEEDDARHQLIDDFMVHLKNLQRASRKVLSKQRDQTPSLQDLLRFEQHEEAMRTGEGSDLEAGLGGAGEEAGGDESADEEKEEDYDEPLKTGRYKGYVLDSIGTFLLKYERDLRCFRATLEKNRADTAVEHDLLKKTRDNATQDVVHNSNGASWVPTRPLPLSDLVRGPSAQYRRGRIADVRGTKSTSKLNGVDGKNGLAGEPAPAESSRKTH